MSDIVERLDRFISDAPAAKPEVLMVAALFLVEDARAEIARLQTELKRLRLAAMKMLAQEQAAQAGSKDRTVSNLKNLRDKLVWAQDVLATGEAPLPNQKAAAGYCIEAEGVLGEQADEITCLRDELDKERAVR